MNLNTRPFLLSTFLLLLNTAFPVNILNNTDQNVLKTQGQALPRSVGVNGTLIAPHMVLTSRKFADVDEVQFESESFKIKEKYVLSDSQSDENALVLLSLEEPILNASTSYISRVRSMERSVFGNSILTDGKIRLMCLGRAPGLDLDIALIFNAERLAGSNQSIEFSGLEANRLHSWKRSEDSVSQLVPTYSDLGSGVYLSLNNLNYLFGVNTSSLNASGSIKDSLLNFVILAQDNQNNRIDNAMIKDALASENASSGTRSALGSAPIMRPLASTAGMGDVTRSMLKSQNGTYQGVLISPGYVLAFGDVPESADKLITAKSSGTSIDAYEHEKPFVCPFNNNLKIIPLKKPILDADKKCYIPSMPAETSVRDVHQYTSISEGGASKVLQFSGTSLNLSNLKTGVTLLPNQPIFKKLGGPGSHNPLTLVGFTGSDPASVTNFNVFDLKTLNWIQNSIIQDSLAASIDYESLVAKALNTLDTIPLEGGNYPAIPMRSNESVVDYNIFFIAAVNSQPGEREELKNLVESFGKQETFPRVPGAASVRVQGLFMYNNLDNSRAMKKFSYTSLSGFSAPVLSDTNQLLNMNALRSFIYNGLTYPASKGNIVLINIPRGAKDTGSPMYANETSLATILPNLLKAGEGNSGFNPELMALRLDMPYSQSLYKIKMFKPATEVFIGNQEKSIDWQCLKIYRDAIQKITGLNKDSRALTRDQVMDALTKTEYEVGKTSVWIDLAKKDTQKNTESTWFNDPSHASKTIFDNMLNNGVLKIIDLSSGSEKYIRSTLEDFLTQIKKYEGEFYDLHEFYLHLKAMSQSRPETAKKLDYVLTRMEQIVHTPNQPEGLAKSLTGLSVEAKETF